MNPLQTPSHSADGLNIVSLWSRLRRNWWWFAITTCIAIAASWLIIRYQAPRFALESTIVVRDNNNRKVGAENLIEGMELFSYNTNLENEMAILKSYRLAKEALKSIPSAVSYYSEGRFRKLERYQNFPFRVELDSHHLQLSGVPMKVEIVNRDSFLLSFACKGYRLYHPAKEKSGEKNKLTWSFAQRYRFGEWCRTDGFAFRLTTTGFDSKAIRPGDELSFKINDLNQLAQRYRGRVNVLPLNKDASIVRLGMETELVEKEVAYLNALSFAYLQNSLDQKNRVAANTITFIGEQLDHLKIALVQTEGRLKDFRSTRQYLEPEYVSEQTSKELEEITRLKAEMQVRHHYYEYLSNTLRIKSDLSGLIAPSAMDIDDFLLNSEIQNLMELYKDKAARDYFAGTDNPELKIINLKIEQTRKILEENVKNILQASDIGLKDLSEREQGLRGRLTRLPDEQQDLVRIERRYNHLEQMHNYLQRKLAEANIALASNTSDNYILVLARPVGEGPVFPRKKTIYLLLLLVALLLPFFGLLVIELNDSTIYLKEQLPYTDTMPVIGQIGHSPNASTFPVGAFPHSPIAEAFRLLRVEVQRITRGKDHSVIGISSYKHSEGKSFCALNLATALAQAGKRVVLVEIDLRKAGSLDWLSRKAVPDGVGLSSYLQGLFPLSSCLLETKVANLHILPGGPKPKFPTELLQPVRIDQLLDELSAYYDYVLLDGPPVSMIADYLLFAPRIDRHLLVGRCGVTTQEEYRELVRMPFFQELNDQRFFVLNDLRGGYGRYATYGYPVKPRAWWRQPVQGLLPGNKVLLK
ncbi:MAG: GumC family protein [Salibacteraceae bacterium]